MPEELLRGGVDAEAGVRRGQQSGLSGHDGDAVNEQFAELLHEGGGEVFRTGGRAGDQHDNVASAGSYLYELVIISWHMSFLS
jgi:hypothetical protein